jgi:hypothetical protein
LANLREKFSIVDSKPLTPLALPRFLASPAGKTFSLPTGVGGNWQGNRMGLDLVGYENGIIV